VTSKDERSGGTRQASPAFPEIGRAARLIFLGNGPDKANVRRHAARRDIVHVRQEEQPRFGLRVLDLLSGSEIGIDFDL